MTIRCYGEERHQQEAHPIRAAKLSITFFPNRSISAMIFR